jgi:hypothetical protein
VESLRRREAEIALARLRGRRGLRLLVFAVAETSLVVLAGAAVGVLVGWLVTRLAVDAWLPAGTSTSLGRDEWTALAVVTVGSLLLVIASSWRILSAPLFDQLNSAGRPRSPATVGLFLQIVLVLAAVVSIYQAHQASSSRVDWVTLASPAVVGLAGGQVVCWLLLAGLAVAVPRLRGGRLGWFLTLRRLLRRADSLGVVRIVVAAGVVFGVSASASIAAQDWREDQAKLQTGGPVTYPVAGGALRAYAAAASADPQKRWLMPAVASLSSDEATGRGVFVGTDRWSAVVGDFFDGTASAPLTGLMPSLHATPPRIVTGRTVSATVVTSSIAGSRQLSMIVQYVDDDGDTARAAVPLVPGKGAPVSGGLTRFAKPLSDCRYACALIEVDIAGQTETPHHPGKLTLVDASFGETPLFGEATGFQLAGRQAGILVAKRGSTFVISTFSADPNNSWRIGGFAEPQAQGAVTTIPAAASRRSHSVPGVDGEPRQVRYVDNVPVLPWAGSSGTLLDLGGVLVASGGSVPGMSAMVVARPDTPDSVLAALRSSHAVGRPTSYEQAVHRLGQTPRALGTRLYVLVALFAGLIALVSIASALAQQLRERRVEAASLRGVGIAAKSVAGAYRREALVLAVTTVVGTAVTAWVASQALLPALPLVPTLVYAPPLDVTPRISFIGLSALVAGVVVGLVTYLAFRRVGRASPPRTLREDLS